VPYGLLILTNGFIKFNRMNNYNFGVLNDKEFENLCKDLLEVECNVSLQIFRSGRDKGIDIRYSNSIENKIVVQVKHYWNSNFLIFSIQSNLRR
jgi:hypothetical protein